MTTTSFSESLKYGGRLFGYFLAIVLVGSGLFVLGGYLAVPEIQAIIGSETVETAPIAGGLVLAALGLATLVIGNFALVYKLLADSVSRGVENTAAVVEMETASEGAAEPSEEKTGELGPSPGEQTARQHGPGQTVPGGEQSPASQVDQPAQEETAGSQRDQQAASVQSQPDESPTQEQPVQQSAEKTTSRPADRPEQSTAEQSQGADEATVASESSAPDDQPVESDSSTTSEHGTASESPSPDEEESREQTAEEIVFGTARRSETEEQESDLESSPDDDEGSADEKQTTAEEREDIETAGNSSADPLGDRFEEK